MVKLICYNIEYCEGIEGLWWQYLQFWRVFFPPRDLDKRMIKALKKYKPDLLALVEVDTGSFRAKKDEAVFFREKLHMNYFVERIKYNFTGWSSLFHFVPILNKQANAIISKYRLEKIKYHVLHEGTKRVLIEATVKCPKRITLLLAHLSLGRKTREKQINEIIKIVRQIKNPVILMGDFNTFNGDDEIKYLLKKTHLKDMVKLDTSPNHMTLPSVHPRKRLDYILVSSRIKVKQYKTLGFHYSDHRPLFIEFKT